MHPERVELQVFRYDPDGTKGESDGYYAKYEVPLHRDWVLLDALNHIKDELDGGLSFRWSCRMGVCGSCGMMINDEAKLACSAFLRDLLPGPIRVDPLQHFPVIRDLVIDMTSFMERLQAVSPWIIREDEADLGKGEYLQTPEQLERYKPLSMCINCMLCYSACPVVGLETDFLGPAAIALAQRYNLDSRDEGYAERREVVFSDEAIWNCTFVGECSKVCPKSVDPAGTIQQLKLRATKEWFLSKLLPFGGNT